MENMIEQLLTSFKRIYGTTNSSDIRIFFAPGRVNLIGEHTDYNGGFVFPAALTLGTYMVIRKREDGIYQLASENMEENVRFDVKAELAFDEADDWGNYPKGVANELKQLDIPLSGADILYFGNIPNGAGLSSSASIEMVTAYAFVTLADQTLSRVELAKLCQRVENHFIGVNSGIMDQYAVGLGEKDHAIFLNCATLEKELIPLQLNDYRIVITNTNKRRGLADSKYNERRQECETGLEILQKYTEINNLGELSLEAFTELEQHLEDPTIRKRVRHVVTEDDRVLRATKALISGELETFGELMKASHLSLRDDYEVTGKELDTLFSLQKEQAGCIGTRMTGAGFGGCTVSIVHKDTIDDFQKAVASGYQAETGLSADFYTCEIGDGVKELK